MLRIVAAFVLWLATSSSVVAVDVLESMSTAGIFADLKIAPPLKVDTLEVKFNGSDLVPGKKFSKDQVAKKPEVAIPNPEEETSYTLLMVDPDAPSRDNPLARSWLHWLMFNIPGGSIKDGNLKCEFNPSTPPPNTGYHRYVFLLYKQAGPLVDFEACPRRGNFDVAGFIANFKLAELVAGNYYETTN